MILPSSKTQEKALAAVRWPLRWTWAGLWAERMLRALWPLASLSLMVLGALVLGLHRITIPWVIWTAMLALCLLALGAIIFAYFRFRAPSLADAVDRLDRSLVGRPLAAILDSQAIGQTDAASARVWAAHQRRMHARASAAHAVPADLKLARFDPFALRYAAVLLALVALLFGSAARIGEVQDGPRGAAQALAPAPVWEGWIEAPRYTNLPTLYLPDQPTGALRLPIGSVITLRFYADDDVFSVSETVSGGGDTPNPAADINSLRFAVRQQGDFVIQGPNGGAWDVTVIDDRIPEVAMTGALSASATGEMRLPYGARDDYAIEGGEAVITLDLTRVDRRFGLAAEPDPRPEVFVPMAFPVTGSRQDFEAQLVENLSQHPWANLPVKIRLFVLDAVQQQGQSGLNDITLPGRRFFDPLAAAIIEQRRDFLWSQSNGLRVSQVLRAISYAPDDIFRNNADDAVLRAVIAKIEARVGKDMTAVDQDAIAAELWELAVLLEDGDLADAAERMRRAQDRLNQAMREGASDAEIAELMEEMRRATQEYLRQLSQQAQNQQSDSEQNAPPEDGVTMTQDDLQQMLDRIQELMEEGRMAEAEEALRQLQELMENMRMSQSQQGGAPSAGEQAMEGLADTLRDQQGLSDQAFRELQEGFNPNAQAGASDENEGRNGGQGRGQSHEGQGGQGGQDGASGAGDDLAERQRQLRGALSQQRENLPGAGTPGGQSAQEALDRAGRAMSQAEEALRGDDKAGAIDSQAEAMDALRDGMQALGDMMAEQSQAGQSGAQEGNRSARPDPLGRDSGNGGANGDNVPLALGEDTRDKARALLDEIRRRSAQTARPEEERSYLNRLLDRF